MDEKLGHNMATTALLAALSSVRESVDKVWQTLERREQVSPGRFIITQNATQIFRAQSIALRLVNWVVALDGADTYELRAGSSVVAVVVTAADATLVIPLEVELDRGVDLSTVALGAGVVISSYVIAYTKEDRS